MVKIGDYSEIACGIIDHLFYAVSYTSRLLLARSIARYGLIEDRNQVAIVIIISQNSVLQNGAYFYGAYF